MLKEIRNIALLFQKRTKYDKQFDQTWYSINVCIFCFFSGNGIIIQEIEMINHFNLEEKKEKKQLDKHKKDRMY